MVSEIFEGVAFDWDSANGIIEKIYEFYGSRDIKIGYISNRVNSYSLYPQDWIKFFKNRHQLSCMAILSTNKTRLANGMLEKLFVKTKLKNFKDLDEAIQWVKENTPNMYTQETTLKKSL